MSHIATVHPSKLLVRHSIRADVNREFLAIDFKEADFDRLSKKVLEFQGRDFAFSGWNSDTMEMYFFRFLDSPLPIAYVKNT